MCLTMPCANECAGAALARTKASFGLGRIPAPGICVLAPGGAIPSRPYIAAICGGPRGL